MVWENFQINGLFYLCPLLEQNSPRFTSSSPTPFPRQRKINLFFQGVFVQKSTSREVEETIITIFESIFIQNESYEMEIVLSASRPVSQFVS